MHDAYTQFSSNFTALLGAGWLLSMTLPTLERAPMSEFSRDSQSSSEDDEWDGDDDALAHRTAPDARWPPTVAAGGRKDDGAPPLVLMCEWPECVEAQTQATITSTRRAKLIAA